MTNTPSTLHFHPATADRWDDLAAFFEQNGNPNYCWCMRWRVKSSDFGKTNAAGRRAQLEQRIKDNIISGMLAYANGRVIGWCSVAPRETFEGLERSRILKRLDNRPVWSVTCFFIDRNYRGRGLASQLLQAAADYAQTHGATLIEGYPIEPDQSYQFMGSPAAFERAGFAHAGTAKNGRPIVRLNLSQQ